MATARRQRCLRWAHPLAALQALGLTQPRPTLVSVGGAGGLGLETLGQLNHLFVDALAPLAQQLGAYVVDGATDSGVIRLMGSARAEIGASFPLIGVAAIGTVILPDAPATNPDAWNLEPNHSHFIFVPGTNWGEVPWVSRVARSLAQELPRVTVLVNGGKIAFRDVVQSINDDCPVVVVAGSGRAADEIADALRGKPKDADIQRLADSGLVQAVDLQAGPQDLMRVIEHILLGKGRI